MQRTIIRFRSTKSCIARCQVCLHKGTSFGNEASSAHILTKTTTTTQDNTIFNKLLLENSEHRPKPWCHRYPGGFMAMCLVGNKAFKAFKYKRTMSKLFEYTTLNEDTVN